MSTFLRRGGRVSCGQREDAIVAFVEPWVAIVPCFQQSTPSFTSTTARVTRPFGYHSSPLHVPQQPAWGMPPRGAQFLKGGALSGHALGLKIAAGNVPNLVDVTTGGLGS